MTDKEISKEALVRIWGWATHVCDGIERGELSDTMEEDILNGQLTEEEAWRLQKAVKYEADIIWRKMQKI